MHPRERRTSLPCFIPAKQSLGLKAQRPRLELWTKSPRRELNPLLPVYEICQPNRKRKGFRHSADELRRLSQIRGQKKLKNVAQAKLD